MGIRAGKITKGKRIIRNLRSNTINMKKLVTSNKTIDSNNYSNTYKRLYR